MPGVQYSPCQSQILVQCCPPSSLSQMPSLYPSRGPVGAISLLTCSGELRVAAKLLGLHNSPRLSHPGSQCWLRRGWWPRTSAKDQPDLWRHNDKGKGASLARDTLLPSAALAQGPSRCCWALRTTDRCFLSSPSRPLGFSSQGQAGRQDAHWSTERAAEGTGTGER